MDHKGKKAENFHEETPEKETAPEDGNTGAENAEEPEIKPQTEEKKPEPEKADDAEKAEKEEEQFDLSALLPDRMEDIVMLQVLQLKEWAHIHMGFIPNPKKKKVVVDVKGAKIAIDSAAALLDVLAPYLEQKQKQDLKIMISDLKMNYISKASQG